MEAALKWAALAVGVGFLYVAGLLRSDERDKFHHWLATVWVRAHDLQLQGLRRQASIAKGTVEAAARMFERVFGKKGLSLRAVSNAVFLSIASVILWMFMVSALPHFQMTWNVWVAAFVAVGLLTCALARDEELKWAFTLAGCGLSFFAAGWFLGPVAFPRDVGRLAVAGAVLALGIACDLLFIAFMRWSLGKASRLETFWGIAAIATLNLAVAVSLALGPLLLGWGSVGDDPRSDPSWRYAIAHMVSLTNTLDVALSLALFGLWALVLVNKLIWPIAERALYAVATEKVLHRRKTLAIIGAYLITVGIPDVGKWIFKLLGVVP